MPTTPPARPVFDLDVNSDTAPVGDGMTTDGTVTLVGQTDPNVTVTLQQTGAVTRSNPNGLFVFFNVPLAAGSNAFTADRHQRGRRQQPVHQDHHAHRSRAST